jgi:LemA protein
MEEKMKVWIAIGIIVLLLIVGFSSYVGAKNQMVTKNETVKAAWSQVDIVLQRRADLIPNLVETVKGIATQEQTVFVEIAKARSQLLASNTPAEKIAANQQLDGAVVKFLAIAEKYPELKSNENFLRLQDELAGTENRIAVERKRYNDALQDYNTFIGLFPNSVWAGMAGFKRNDAYFAASEGAKTAPKVDFSGVKPTPPAQATPQPAH